MALYRPQDLLIDVAVASIASLWRRRGQVCFPSDSDRMAEIAACLKWAVSQACVSQERVSPAVFQARFLQRATLKALRTALEQVLDEEAAKSEQFKRVLENWRAFRTEQHRWFWIADARTETSVYALTAAQQTNL